MIFPPDIAQAIVAEIHQITNQHINLMDAQGKIIASTDLSRVGSTHEGALRVIEQGLNELYISPREATATARAGLNLPIRLDSLTVGVIGITGEYEQVFRYGQIVRRVTEILLQDSLRREQALMERQVRERFLEEWLLGDGLASGSRFLDWGLALGIDVRQRRRVLAYQIIPESITGDDADTLALTRVEESIEVFITQAKRGSCWVLRHKTCHICVFEACPDEQLKALGEALLLEMRRFPEYTIMIGADGEPKGSRDVNISCIQAQRALQACRVSGRQYMLWSEMTIESLLADISVSAQRLYLRKVFPFEDKEKIRQYLGIIEAYFLAEGSIARASEQMHMHKNTYQYWLKQLVAVCGYDLRKPSQAAVYQLALMFARSAPELLDD